MYVILEMMKNWKRYWFCSDLYWRDYILTTQNLMEGEAERDECTMKTLQCEEISFKLFLFRHDKFFLQFLCSQKQAMEMIKHWTCRFLFKNFRVDFLDFIRFDIYEVKNFCCRNFLYFDHDKLIFLEMSRK